MTKDQQLRVHFDSFIDREIVNSYLVGHPEAKDEIRHAMFAYNTEHFSQCPGAHHFATSFHVHENRQEECFWCKRTREQIRWSDLPPECAARPESADESIKSIIDKEIALFSKVLERAKKIALSLDIKTITGEDLARLHHTHGVDPSMLECALIELDKRLPETAHQEYLAAYGKHRQTGAIGAKPKQILIAKTL